jgi:DNA-binding transcriptional regulator YiaG
MTPKDFRILLDYHGLSQNRFAKLAAVNERQVRRWCDLKRAHPLPLGAEARIRQAFQNGISSETETTR